MATSLIGAILRRRSNGAFLFHFRMPTKSDLFGHPIGILPLPQFLLPKSTSRKLISRTLCSDFSFAFAPFLCRQSSSFCTVAECDVKSGIASSNGLATKSNKKKARMKSKVDFTKIDPSLLPTVIIVGRPNVGKSALFNRLIRRREALVYNTPDDHVTRDIREGIAKLGDLRFKVLDSAGLETEATSGTILSRTTEMTGMVLARTQVAILLIDGWTSTA